MPKFHIQDLRFLENTPTSPASLRNKIGEMIVCSTTARAKVEAINPETGEYRVVLQGTLDREETKWDEKSWPSSVEVNQPGPSSEGPSPYPMPSLPVLRTIKIEYGPLQAATSLNTSFSPDSRLLLATLDIEWDEPDPYGVIARLEDALLAFSGSFAQHECRGEQVYHVFLGAGRQFPARPEGASGGEGAPCAPWPFDGSLALAHLIEHAIIDFQCAITELRRCSGVTAAYRSPGNRFDIIVECPDRRIGETCLVLALFWLVSAISGERLGPTERQVLAAARLAYGRRGEGLTSRAVARGLGWSVREAERALAALEEAGYLERIPYSFNFSGVAEYRVAGDGPETSSEDHARPAPPG